MYEKFNPSFQNTLSPQQLNGINPYGDQYYGEYDRTPYVQALNPPLPGMSTVGTTSMAQTPYPIQSSLATPNLSTPVNAVTPSGYAKGGEIKEKKRRKKEEHINPYPSLVEMIRQQGQGGDTILAHINPIEAMILKQMGGSGTINPVTGLPEFFFPFIPALIAGGVGLGAAVSKKFRKTALPIAGSILGNMIAPGIGGVIGGGLGGAIGNPKRPLQGAALGGLGGAAIPYASSLLGSGLSGVGATGLGRALSSYGASNALFPSLLGAGVMGGKLGAATKAATTASALSHFATPSSQIHGVSVGDMAENPLKQNLLNKIALGIQPTEKEAEFAGKLGYGDILGAKSKSFFTNPENLLTLGVVGSQFLGRKSLKEQKREEAQAQKEYNRIMKGTEAERLAEAQLQRKIEHNKFLPEERLGNLEGLILHRKEHTPEEHQRTGRWFSYYNNPAFMGAPVPYKTGGPVQYVREHLEAPMGLGHFLQGETGGQDDKIPAMLSDGEYVIDATTVANLGDGNNEAGAKKLDIMVRNIRKHKGGSAKLPPKAKKINTYMENNNDTICI